MALLIRFAFGAWARTAKVTERTNSITADTRNFFMMNPLLYPALNDISRLGRGRVTWRESILFLLLFPLQIGNAFLHPVRRGAPFQGVIKEFLQPPRIVFLIDPLSQAMLLAVIAEHVHFFAQSA